jgi:D-glycero-D-manno-heptose 1,7-bisphosphate phosphatase
MFHIRSPEGHISSGPYPPCIDAAAAWARGRDPLVTLVTVHGPDQQARWSGWALLPQDLPEEARQAVLVARARADLRTISIPMQVVRCAPERRPSVALLDRDGTIIEDRHYLADPAGVMLLPGAAAGLRTMQSVGVRLVVVSNQSGVGRGRITPEQLDAVTGQFDTCLKEAGVTLAGIYICPHTEADQCDCRKPAPGLALRAARDLGLDLGSAVVVGDKAADLGLGNNLGVPTFLVLTGEGRTTLAESPVRPDYVVDDLAAAARICASPAGLILPSSLAELR